MKNLVNELFEKSGRPAQGDNRSYYVKCLNKILSDGLIKIALQNKGMIWTNPKHKDAKGGLIKFNIEISAYGYKYRSYDNNFDAKDLLMLVGKFVKNEKVAKAHTESMRVNGLEVVPCSKCHAQGFIKAFSHICQGICFDCYGSKSVVKRFSITV